jgi:hypothetical protein
MTKSLVFTLALFFVSDLLACPYCAGSTQSGKDSNTTLILALFILAIYIPYYLIYRMIKKHRALKEAYDSSGPTNS